MKNKLTLVLLFSIFITNALIAQAPDDLAYNQKIELIEQKIAQLKALPKEEQKQYITILSDVENRKNILKSLLKTPSTKRDKTWEGNWTQNYTKATNKLDKIPLK